MYNASKLFRIHLTKNFNQHSRYFSDKNGVVNFLGSNDELEKSNFNLLKKYFSNDSVELLSFDRKDLKKEQNKELTITKQNEHRNIVMTNYMNAYWDLRKDYIVPTELGQKTNASFRLGNDASGQEITIQSIFNNTLNLQKKSWNLIFESVNNMIKLSQIEKEKQESMFQDVIKIAAMHEVDGVDNTCLCTIFNISDQGIDVIFNLNNFLLNKVKISEKKQKFTGYKSFFEYFDNSNIPNLNTKVSGTIHFKDMPKQTREIFKEIYSVGEIINCNVIKFKIPFNKFELKLKGMTDTKPEEKSKFYLESCKNILKENDEIFREDFEHLKNEIISKNYIDIKIGERAKILNTSFKGFEGIVKEINEDFVFIEIEHLNIQGEIHKTEIKKFSLKDVRGLKK